MIDEGIFDGDTVIINKKLIIFTGTLFLLLFIIKEPT